MFNIQVRYEKMREQRPIFGKGRNYEELGLSLLRFFSGGMDLSCSGLFWRKNGLFLKKLNWKGRETLPKNINKVMN